MTNARKKGHSFELVIRDKLRELGFKGCQTSRYASRMADDAKVDVVGCEPLLPQIKAWERAPSYHSVLESMPKDGMRLIYHKKNRQGVVVVMTMDDWHGVLKKLIKHKML